MTAEGTVVCSQRWFIGDVCLGLWSDLPGLMPSIISASDPPPVSALHFGADRIGPLIATL